MKHEQKFIEALTTSQEALRGYCYSKVRNWADADDVLQATNVKLWEKAADWDRDRPFLPWALGVARFTLLSHFRDQGRDRLLFDEDVMELMESHFCEAATEIPEVIDALRVCLEKMDEKQREMLRAHYVVGWSMAEIAKTTNRSVSAIKSLFLRLRLGLAGCMNRQKISLEEGGGA